MGRTVIAAAPAALGAGVLAASPASAATRTVDKVSGPYATITDALPTADPRDTMASAVRSPPRPTTRSSTAPDPSTVRATSATPPTRRRPSTRPRSTAIRAPTRRRSGSECWELTVRATDRAGNLATSVLHFTVT
jgi:hypothetical protein